MVSIHSCIPHLLRGKVPKLLLLFFIISLSLIYVGDYYIRELNITHWYTYLHVKGILSKRVWKFCNYLERRGVGVGVVSLSLWIGKACGDFITTIIIITSSIELNWIGVLCVKTRAGTCPQLHQSQLPFSFFQKKNIINNQQFLAQQNHYDSQRNPPSLLHLPPLFIIVLVILIITPTCSLYRLGFFQVLWHVFKSMSWDLDLIPLILYHIQHLHSWP